MPAADMDQSRPNLRPQIPLAIALLEPRRQHRLRMREDGKLSPTFAKMHSGDDAAPAR